MKWSVNEKDKLLHEILLSSQTGTIVCRLASILKTTPYEAFRNFIKSDTYRLFRIPKSSYSYLGDEAICQLYLKELEQL